MSASDTKAETRLDPRRNPFRPDLAAKHLKGQVTADKFVEGTRRQVLRAAAPLRRTPIGNAGLDTEVLFGETVLVFEESEGWAWIQSEADSYTGYIPADAVTDRIIEPTHRVRASGTFIYPKPDIKTPPLLHLSLNARVAVAENGETFSALATGGFVVTRHLIEQERYARDFVTVAEGFIGVPYLWGGKTRIGLDCSALVQLSLYAAGINAPRDTDMQQDEVGESVLIPESLEGLERGDLIFWKGHVGIMSDSVLMVHANAHHMSVAVETLPEAASRIAKSGTDILAIKRLPKLSSRPS